MDSKTGLLNAGTWEREAASEVARAVRTRSPLALVLIDVDHFKMVNDLHGHLAGDKALRAIAHVFRIFLRDYDLAGRFGGEEFAVLLPQTSAADARHIAERVRLHIAETPIQSQRRPGCGARPDYGVHGRGGARPDLGTDHRQPAHGPASRGGPGSLPGQERGPEPRGHGDRHGNRGGPWPTRAGCPAYQGCCPGGPPRRGPSPGTRRKSRPDRSGQAEGDGEADPEGMASTARISEGPFEHFDASPVRRIWGVSNPLHTQPLTETGPPPPLPGARPGGERGRVGVLDRHGRMTAHRSLPDIHHHRDARCGFPGAALAAGRGGHGRLRGRGRGRGLGRAGGRTPRERAPGECGQGKNGGPSLAARGTAHGGLLSRPSSCRYPALHTRPALACRRGFIATMNRGARTRPDRPSPGAARPSTCLHKYSSSCIILRKGRDPPSP